MRQSLAAFFPNTGRWRGTTHRLTAKILGLQNYRRGVIQTAHLYHAALY
jgi:hypothetical protein